MRVSKATFEVSVKVNTEEYNKMSDLLATFGNGKGGKIVVNGVGLDVYSMDASFYIEYPLFVTFKIVTNAVHPVLITDLLESIYSEQQ